MFGSLGGGEIALILVLALLLFGPRKLPQIGRMLGKSLSEFRRATQDFKLNLEHEVRREEIAATRPQTEAPQGTVPVPVAAVDAATPATDASSPGVSASPPPRDDEPGQAD